MSFSRRILLPLVALGLLFPGISQGEDVVAALAAQASGTASSKEDIHAQQKALVALENKPGPKTDKFLLKEFTRFRNGDLPTGLWLEFFEAAGKSRSPELKAALAEREKKLAASHDPLVRFHECLEGGDAAAGREIFMKDVKAGCMRCHRVGGEEGGQIGPDLTALHQTTDRLFILESIIDPNAVIAPGFQNVLLTLKSGESVSGILSLDGEDEVVITSVIDGKRRRIPTADITERTPLPSAMPPGFGLILSKRALRDLVEFIAKAR